jgi:hypothetical protein
MDPVDGQAEGPQVAAGDDLAVAVPSGQQVTLQDVIWNVPGPNGLAIRFRFLAPAIAKAGGTVDFATAAADMAHLCQSFALPRVSDFGPRPTQIIISFADQPVPFGEPAPEATQFFEAYRLENDACIWEPF